MNTFRKALCAPLLALLVAASGAAWVPAKPVTPDAMPETVALLTLLKDISGRYTLTGQHNFPASGDRNSRFAASYIGKVPAVWTSDFGFAASGDKDSYLMRPAVVREAIRQHGMGSIISLCWHAVPPTADEPVTFRPLPGSDPKLLKSVQGRLSDDQFRDVLTPGTALYNHWAEQVDVIAGFLRQLQDAHVPVIWRPYHEMNGDWFWWGGRSAGPYTTAALYRQIFDRLVNHHHLRNLVWLWSVDRVSRPNMEHEKYFPGLEYVDVLGLDVYGNDFAQSYYDSLVRLSGGKPIALAEVGSPPVPTVMERQPLWTYYAIWAGMVRGMTRSQYDVVMGPGRMLGRDDPAYEAVTADYRRACGLTPLHYEKPPADFSGTWVLNEDLSTFGPMGPGASPSRLDVTQVGTALTVQTTQIREFSDDDVSEVKYILGGAESKSQFMRSPRTTAARLSSDLSRIVMESTTSLSWGAPGSRIKSTDEWTLLNHGDRLSIHTVSDSYRGPGKVEQTLVFDRR
jgi:mannan endo-1,4-beta-mannosidase